MKLVLKIAAGVIIAVVVLAAGCAVLLGSASKQLAKKQAWTVIVSAPRGKCWSGSFGERTVDGCGTRRVRIRESLAAAANAQKQGGGRWRLRLALVDANGKTVDRQTTRAAYGLVTVTG